ncbi:metal ABC transporter solute-binding protein, Zn/Mn family [Fuchsiella alkaliacetigena]|uniref:metal ABC transporter solute-binding protein, Zn/Mn family n=1 Tax=Fuchsiella alkaliacetigena TaxID=957042 RepID=UPI00200ABEB3|nr:zinc ABC transporter substrate-binding protein [Fuchsiella alkaliacetigena]MCK8823735.1 zinc ABC transporter substrate-binding protein [Fuchsiella alkaliacetigena]
MKKLFLISLLLLFSIALLGCGQQEEAVQLDEAEEVLQVYSSFYPLHYVSEEIGGELVNSQSIVPIGDEVHTYEISPQQIAELENADLFFYNGLGLEPWAKRVSDNIEKMGVEAVKVSEVIDLLEFEKDSHHCDHSEHGAKKSEHSKAHNEIDHHHHGDYDPHIWLNPVNMKEIGRLVLDKFVEVDAENEEYYQRNYQNFAEQLAELDQKYQEALGEREQDHILVSHSAFAYLADRYGLEELAVAGVSSHQEPSTGGLAKLSEKVKAKDLEYIFLETLANPKTAEVLAQEVELEVLTLNPIEGLTEAEQEAGEDYLSIMKSNLDALKKALVN